MDTATVESDIPSAVNDTPPSAERADAPRDLAAELALKVADLEMRLLEVLALVRELPGARTAASNSPISFDELSTREREVARYLSVGLNSATVAKELGISVHTVRSHRRRVYEKLAVHSQGELMAKFQGLRGVPGISETLRGQAPPEDVPAPPQDVL